MSQDVNMTPNGDAPQSALRPWLRGVLFVSLALNLAVVGMVAGAYFRFGGPDSDKRPARPDQMGGAYTHALTHEDRRAIWRDMRRQNGNKTGRAEMRQLNTEVLQILRSDPFDPNALAAALQRQIAFGQLRAEIGQALLIERLTDMPAADRIAYADRLEQAFKTRRGARPKNGQGKKPGKTDERGAKASAPND